MDPKMMALQELKKMLEGRDLDKLKGAMPMKVEKTAVEMQDSDKPESAPDVDSDVQEMIASSDQPTDSQQPQENEELELLKKIYEQLS